MVDAAREPGERVGNMLVLAELHYGLRDYAQVEAVCREILALELVEERGEQSYFPKEKAYFLLGDAHGLAGLDVVDEDIRKATDVLLHEIGGL